MTRLAVLLRTTFFLVLLVCASFALANSQNQKVTIQANAETLASIFKKIKSQTKLVVFYSNELVNDQEKMTINVKEESLSTVMDKIVAGKPLKYEIREKQIVISAKGVEPKTQPQSSGVNLNITELHVPPPTVRGRITNDKGEPVAGVSISIKGGKVVGVTNDNGEFALNNIPDNATLVFEAVNMEKFERALEGRSELALIAKVKVSELEEVVINKGYYSEKQRFSTGNTGKVVAKDIEKQPVQNPLLALQGRVPGIQITQNSGVSGGGITVRIQGRNSLSYGNDPLYVVDGVPYFSQLPATNAGDGILSNSGGMPQTNSVGNPLSYLNPLDIESIEVLKDADATAIYGSRAANGALLITTKKGKAGETRFDINIQSGWGYVGRKVDMLNARQYLDMRYESLKNDGILLSSLSPTSSMYSDLKVWDTTRSSNWQKALIGGNAQYTSMTGSMTGGNNSFQYLFSGTYHKETSVFPGDQNDQKGSIHFSVTSSTTNNRFKLQFSGSYMLDENKLPVTDLTAMALRLEPIAPALFIDDRLNWAPNAIGNSTWRNPLAELTKWYKNRTLSMTNNLQLRYTLLPNLTVSSSLGLNTMITKDFAGTPMVSFRPEDRANSQRSAIFGDRQLNLWVWEPQISYVKKVNNGDLEAMIGCTVQQSKSEAGSIGARGFNSDDVLENKGAASTFSNNGQYIVQYKYAGIFGRVNYKFKNRYVLNLVGRRDGTSRFGANYQMHNFGSVGGAWLFGEENWNNKEILSFGKLRASYGTTGSDQIGDYTFMSLYSFIGQSLPYQGSVGINADGVNNPYLRWEETRKIQTGVDLGLFSDKLFLSVTFSRNRTSSQLLSYQLPSFTGNTSIITNLPATIENSSWEFSTTVNLIKKQNVDWTINANLTIPYNRLIDFPGIEKTSYVNSYVIGQTTQFRKLYRFAGVNPANGLYQIVDVNGNPTSSPSFGIDNNTIVDQSVRFFGGLQNSIKIGKFELDFLMQFSKNIADNYSYNNGFAFPGEFSAGNSNQMTTVLNRWQNPGDISNIAKFTTTSSVGPTTWDKSYIDASYLRLKNLSITYQFPDRWIRVAHLRTFKIYMQGQNLATITGWKGLDPETPNFTSLPPLRVWTFGMLIGL